MHLAPRNHLRIPGRGHILALVLGLTLGSSVTLAQPKPDQRINTTIQGVQFNPAVATQSTGEKFFVWERGARRFEADGTPRDILDFDPGVGIQPDVAMNEQGDVVVVGEVDSEIQARLYTFDDSLPPSNLIGIHPGMPQETQRFPSVAMDATGSFVVVYTVEFSDAPDEYSVFMRRFGPDGIPLGDVQEVNSPDQNFATAPDVAMRPDGTFAVGWYQGIGIFPAGDASPMLRFYSNDGMPLTDPITLSTEVGFSTGLTFTPTGSLLMTFHTFDGIWSALYDTSGQLLAGPHLLVVAIPGNSQRETKVAAFDSGEFHITWDQGNGMADVFGLRLSTDGSALGSPFLVHLDTNGLQRSADIAAVGNEPIIAFNDPDGDSVGITAACFLPDGCVEMFVDGFESGNTAAWSASQP